MIHSAPLSLDQFQDKDDSAELPIEFDVWSYWHSEGYPVEDIVEAYSVVHTKPDDKDTAHIVLKVTTLNKPLDRADIVEDTVELWTCDCGRYQYHEQIDLEDHSLTDWGHCHHIGAIDKTVKAKEDKDQTELV